MSTSVILEGSVQTAQSSNETTWNGTWRFSKDKKGTLQFEYKKISREVPQDLYQYVSFLDPASLNDPTVQTGASFAKIKKRGRGRPRSNSQGIAPIDETDVAKGTPAGDNNTNSADNENKNDSTGENVEKAAMDVDIANDNATNNPMTEVDVKDQRDDIILPNQLDVDTSREDLEENGLLNEDETNEKDSKALITEPISITEDHPLMGLWEGSFKVKNVKGAEDTVPETLFFYSTLGSDPPTQFKDLPPEPSFPFCLMKGPQWTAFLNSQIPQKELATAVTINSTYSEPQNDAGNQNNTSSIANEDSTVPSAKLEKSEECKNPSADSSNEMHSTISVKEEIKFDPQQVSSSSTTVSVIPQDGVSADASQLASSNSTPSVNPIAAAAFDQICKRVLIGFGRNAIGRFSVAAVFDEVTGEMRCEKKYMTVKHSIKRGRRSYAEYAMAYSNGLQEGIPGTTPPALGIKPQRRFSIDTATGADGETNAFHTRQRTKNSLYYPYDDEDMEGPLSTKKKRISGSTPNATSVPSSSVAVKKENGSSGYKSNKDTPATVLTEDNIHEYLRMDKNALIGPRNPDNDLVLAQSCFSMMKPSSSKNGKNVSTSSASSNLAPTTGLATSNLAAAVFDLATGILYRDAFMDEDSGEIYEGEWFNGNRHGRGIVLYADGLMYEGNWLKGKEHGKGELMLSDRTVIYSGDWYEGCFHGQGTYYFPNGDVYSGDWKEGTRHGRGEYIFAQYRTPSVTSLPGDQLTTLTPNVESSSAVVSDVLVQPSAKPKVTTYFGDWRDNKRHGKGRFTWSDESFYEGDWENDLRHGRGLLELANGFKYEGNWFRNIMEGKGTCIFPSGQSYQGTFRGGLRDGRGSITFAEGAVYEGRFREDRFDGNGTLKINKSVPGIEEDEVFIPIQLQSDLWRIHWKAGFGSTHH